MIPQLFAYAVNFATAKFLQAQSKVIAMAIIAATALFQHSLLSWLLMLKLGWGMAGGAAVLNVSWWLIDGAQIVYICGGSCGRALMEGFQESQRLCKIVSCLCSHGLPRGLVLHGVGSVCGLPQEPSSLCGCSLDLHEHIGMADHGGLWLQCGCECKNVE